ncbi:MAG: sulfatase-like hydrolase/transferase, partial [Verrucomicrobiae bacterium]|nr:sulfatase-like hydrolase/transferase [Verrucomicrobiae bacterium]
IRFGLARAVVPPQRNYGLSTEERTLPEALAEAGYKHRGIFGKWHLGHLQAKWHPLARGFTHFEGHYNGAIDYFTHEREGENDWHINYEPTHKEGYSTDLIAEAASNFIREHAREDAPYFCYVPFNAPHSPFQAKEEVLKRLGVNSKKPSREETLKAMIWSLDEGVGKILETIEESGEAENTQVWFMSDNGGIGGVKGNNAPLHGNKLTTFEGGVRVVACVRWPAAWKGGRKVENTMGYIDIFPTLVDTAGIDPNSGIRPGRPLDGVSLDPLLRGKVNSFPERDWYSYHGQSGQDHEHYGLKADGWKLVVEGFDLRRDGLTDNHEVFLYKIQDDLNETNNLAEKYPQVVKDLEQKVLTYRELQPDDAVTHFWVGRDGFVPPKDWRIEKP